MKRTSIFAIGLGMLLGFSVLTPGCGDDGDSTQKDSSVDTRKSDAAVGPMGTGGSMRGTGGSMRGAGGAMGLGGTTVISGKGGSMGMGGAMTKPDGGTDARIVRRDAAADTRIRRDTRDAFPQLVEVGIDVPGMDVMGDGAPPRDVALDSEPAGIDGAIDTEEGIDVGGID